jgi:hypothetical protein
MSHDAKRDGAWARRADSASGSAARPRMSRTQLLERILSMNPSATATFLGRFDDQALAVYLDHLVAAERPRGRDAHWQRPGDSPPIMVSRPGR